MFIDKVAIKLKAGKGGNGVNSFFRSRFMRASTRRKGKPSGGDGGCGGNVIVRADARLHTLRDFYYCRNFSAKNGAHGSGNGKRGRDGDDCLILVPCGTVIKDLSIDCILRDLKSAGDSVIVAKGGAIGKGNQHAEVATEGELGERKHVQLELKLIADVGIIGMPNSGKSTLLSAISGARPKIASYPFTTKSPALGIVNRGDFTFVVADIPGLILDAHLGKGLGFEFLRHIERTKILIHLVDMSLESAQNPTDSYHAINRELGLYSNKLLDRPQVIVANKMDLSSSQENLNNFKKAVGSDIIAISAKKKDNLEELIDAITQGLQENCR